MIDWTVFDERRPIFKFELQTSPIEKKNAANTSDLSILHNFESISNLEDHISVITTRQTAQSMVKKRFEFKRLGSKNTPNNSGYG